MIRNFRALSTLVGIFYAGFVFGQAPKKPKMTVFCYMVADISEESALHFNCSAMEGEGVPSDMHLLFYVVRTVKDKPTDYFDGTIKGHEMEYVKKPARNLGHSGLFLQGLRKALRDNGDHLCVVIAHHTGKEMQVARKSFLVTPEMPEALGKFMAESNKTIDLVILDAGLTATDQMISIFSPYARLMLASQTPERVGGLPYNFMISAFKDGNRTPESLGRAFVKSHEEYYKYLTKKYSAALFDLNTLKPLSELLQGIRDALLQSLKHARVQNYPSYARNYFDIRATGEHLLNARKYKNAPQDKSFKDGLLQVIALVKKGTLCHVAGRAKGDGLSYGLSTFLPVNQAAKRR